MTLTRALGQNMQVFTILPPSLCTLLESEVVSEHLIRHSKEYRIPPISQLHCPTSASVIILLAGSPRVSFCVISLAITALL